MKTHLIADFKILSHLFRKVLKSDKILLEQVLVGNLQVFK